MPDSMKKVWAQSDQHVMSCSGRDNTGSGRENTGPWTNNTGPKSENEGPQDKTVPMNREKF